MSLILSGGMVVTLDEAFSVHEQADIRVEDGAIASIGRSPAPRDAEILDAGDAIVLPGWLNAHTHSPETLMRGAVDRIGYDDWLPAIWPKLDRLDPAEIRLAALLGCIEMLHSGTTAVVDHFRQTPMRLEAVNAAAAAYREAGMRAAIAIMARDRAMPPWAGPAAPSAAETIALCAAAADACDPETMISIMPAPSAPQRCSDALLRGIGDLAAQRGLHIHMHVNETRAQRDEAAALYGHSAVRHLAELGLLGPRTSLAHCVWIDTDDIALLAEHGATVVHNPVSNLRLGSGTAPAGEMARHGVALALGSDGAASNDSQNMFEAMKIACLASAAVAPAARRIGVADVLSMTARAAPQRLGFGTGGAIAVGRAADLAVIERADARLRPLNDIHRQLVYGGAGFRVRHLLIAGRVVVRDGTIQTFDEQAVLGEADGFLRRRL